jgi:hypothetical protein
MKTIVASVVLAIALAGGEAAAADEPGRALFALIIGVNASPSPELAPLRYADDDAARYLELTATRRAAAKSASPKPHTASSSGIRSPRD